MKPSPNTFVAVILIVTGGTVIGVGQINPPPVQPCTKGCWEVEQFCTRANHCFAYAPLDPMDPMSPATHAVNLWTPDQPVPQWTPQEDGNKIWKYVAKDCQLLCTDLPSEATNCSKRNPQRVNRRVCAP